MDQSPTVTAASQYCWQRLPSLALPASPAPLPLRSRCSSLLGSCRHSADRETALYFAGLGLAMPQGFAGAMSPFQDRAGAASSLVGFVQQTSAAALGAVVGHTLGQTAWPLAVAIAAMGCLTLVIWMFSRGIRAQSKDRLILNI